VNALTLAETTLTVSEKCIDCGDCLLACPVGALRFDLPSPAEPAVAVRRRYDLVVIGAGPGGSVAARTAAEGGLSVLLLEKRQEIGSPVRCAEGVGAEGLAAFIDPDPRWISAEVNSAEITTINKGVQRVRRASGGHGYILERRVFDRVLAEQAAQAGAQVRVKTAATGLIMEAGRVCGVQIKRGDFYSSGGAVDVEAAVVIAADGVEAQVGSWAGLDCQLALRDTMVCVQYLLAGIEVDPACTAYVIDHEVAPGGYAWIFPKGEGKANVGLGVQADLWQTNTARPGTVGEGTVLAYLSRFIGERPFLAQGYPVTLVAGNVPVALSPDRIVTDGLMLVGDAARQVDPLTGGGIINAMMAGKLAAEVALEALTAGDISATFLSRYPERWHRVAGRRLQRNYRLREKLPPEQRTTERFVSAFALTAGG
jgi:digeranylgeranylglycerophospholipid reductase